jgi:hypothetical protein
MSNRITVGDPVREGESQHFAVDVDGRSYKVSVSDSDAHGLAPQSPAREVVRESFVFLLEREPPGSILGSFDISVIERYFPGYRKEITRRLSG